MRSIILLLIGLFFTIFLKSQVSDRYNEKIMRATFKIAGNGSQGTAFMVLRPVENYPPNKGLNTLVTAKHVLEQMKGDSAVIYFREKKGDHYVQFEHKFRIRNKGKNIFISHPTEDIAALAFPIPKNVDCNYIPYSNLAIDSTIKLLFLQPGDNLYILGYPYGYISSEAGFPVLRSGRIASYPILPMSIYKSFLLDFEVFNGNSGGPVFYNQGIRIIDGQVQQEFYHFIIGLISEEAILIENRQFLNEQSIVQHKLSLAKVIYSSYILETIKMVPN
ncbi:MAG: serine protease [Bacteroidales bacterium]|nr:serine protease [Bacteroidales bacterium]